MATSDPGPVTGLQLDVLRALWGAGEATVSQVHEALGTRRELAPTTVATLLKRLEKRGLVTHSVEGRQYRYRALAQESEVVQRAVDELATQVFDGDLTAFAAQLLSREDVQAGDLERIRELIDRRMDEL